MSENPLEKKNWSFLQETKKNSSHKIPTQKFPQNSPRGLEGIQHFQNNLHPSKIPWGPNLAVSNPSVVATPENLGMEKAP